MEMKLFCVFFKLQPTGIKLMDVRCKATQNNVDSTLLSLFSVSFDYFAKKDFATVWLIDISTGPKKKKKSSK